MIGNAKSDWLESDWHSDVPAGAKQQLKSQMTQNRIKVRKAKQELVALVTVVHFYPHSFS